MVQDPVVGGVFSGCKVEKKLGEGGMGSVYLATREDGGEQVVVKFLAAQQAADKNWRARFEREARVMQRIAHPNIVGVHSVDAMCERPHIVMEFVDGHELADHLRGGRSLPPKTATQVARDVALALAHAHAAGVIHRDIKPANVLVSKAGAVKVLDFGLAKSVAEEADDGLSMPGMVLGTPHYMAPEQWGDHAVDARCDVFSLGAMLYHLVTGQLPFPGKKPGAIAKKVLKGEFTRPSEVKPEVPDDLELVIFKMMERDRAYRYPNAKQASEDLQRILDGQQVQVPRLIEVEGPEPGRRYPLLPGASFIMGRDEACPVSIVDRSVSRQHARLDRDKTGYVLHDLGSTYGTFVGGMRIRDVVLKDRDQLRLGKVTLEFRDGGAGATAFTARQALPSDRLRVRTIPLPFVDALIELGDRRAVLTLLERLAPFDLDDRVGRARIALRMRIGGELAEKAGQAMEKTLRKAKRRAPAQLFSITHENLATDVERWLAWWDQARGRFPAQLAPQHSSAPSRFEVVAGEPDLPRTIELDKETTFGVGREKDCAVQLNNRSVSRLHATVFRFHERYVIRDEGSRFGTLLNGERVRLAFLRPGDRLGFGKVELEFHADTPDASATYVDELQNIDSEAFAALAGLAHPTACEGLIRYLETFAGGLSFVSEEAQRLFPKDGARREKLEALVRQAYASQATRAKTLLPKIFGEDKGDDAAAWRALLEAKDDLPVQLLPRGWFSV